MNQDHFWGISSPVAGTPVCCLLRLLSSDFVTEIYHTQIRLREGYTDGLNNWTIAGEQ